MSKPLTEMSLSELREELDYAEDDWTNACQLNALGENVDPSPYADNCCAIQNEIERRSKVAA